MLDRFHTHYECDSVMVSSALRCFAGASLSYQRRIETKNSHYFPWLGDVRAHAVFFCSKFVQLESLYMPHETDRTSESTQFYSVSITRAKVIDILSELSQLFSDITWSWDRWLEIMTKKTLRVRCQRKPLLLLSFFVSSSPCMSFVDNTTEQDLTVLAQIIGGLVMNWFHKDDVYYVLVKWNQ